MTSLKKELGVLYNYNYTFSKNTTYEGEILSGSATSVEQDSYVEMTVYSKNAKVVRQTEKYFPNYTDKVKRCTMMCILNTLSNTTGYTSRIGVFDDDNDKTANNDNGGTGYFFALIDNIFYIGIRTGNTNNGTDILVSQDNFNFNTLPNLDLTQIQVFEIEYSSKGNANFYISTNSDVVLVHGYINDDDLSPDIKRLNLPIRYEILKTGNQGNTGEMRQYSTSLKLIDRFTYVQRDRDFKISTDNIYNNSKLIVLNEVLDSGYIKINDDDYDPLFSLRLNPSNPRRIVKNLTICLYHKNSGGKSIILGIVKNANLSRSNPSWSSVSNSILQYSTNSNNVNNNSLDFVYVRHYNGVNDTNYNIDLDITSNIEGDPNVYTFIARSISSEKSDIAIGVHWYE